MDFTYVKKFIGLFFVEKNTLLQALKMALNGMPYGPLKVSRCKPPDVNPGRFTPQKGVSPSLSCKRFLKKGVNPPGVNPAEGLLLDTFSDLYGTGLIWYH